MSKEQKAAMDRIASQYKSAVMDALIQLEVTKKQFSRRYRTIGGFKRMQRNVVRAFDRVQEARRRYERVTNLFLKEVA